MKKLQIFSIYKKKKLDNNIFDNTIYLSNIKNKLLKKKKISKNSIFLYYLENNSRKKLSVLDYGGGAGEYYVGCKIPKNIKIDIYDSKKLIELGKKYSNKNIFFTHEKKNLKKKYDIIFINSVFQYVTNINKLISYLLIFNPKILIFSDFYGTEKKKFNIFQNYYNYCMKVHFHNIKNLENKFKKNGYKLLFKSPYIPNIFGKFQFYDTSNLPKKYQSNFSYNLIFEQN